MDQWNNSNIELFQHSLFQLLILSMWLKFCRENDATVSMEWNHYDKGRTFRAHLLNLFFRNIIPGSLWFLPFSYYLQRVVTRGKTPVIMLIVSNDIIRMNYIGCSSHYNNFHFYASNSFFTIKLAIIFNLTFT